jgi:peroxiredoxin
MTETRESNDTEAAFALARAAHPTLVGQIAAYAAGLAERHPATSVAYRALVETLIGGEAGVGAPKPGDRLPPFVLPDETGHLLTSEALLAVGPLVVSFNRGSWCPMCWLELTALEALREDVTRRGGEIVSIVPEAAVHCRQLKTRLGLGFPVLSDIDNGYALELGLATSLSNELRELFTVAGIDIGLYQRSDAWFVPIPATFVVDRGGLIRATYVNADFHTRGEPADVLAVLS